MVEGSQSAEGQYSDLTGCSQTEFLSKVFAAAPGFMAVLRGPEHIFAAANPAYYELIGQRAVIGKPVREALPEIRGQGYFKKLDEAFRTGKPVVATNSRVLLERTPGHALEERFIDFVYQPFTDASNAVIGICAHGCDVSGLKHAERKIADTQRRKDEFIAVLAHELRNPLAPIHQAAKIAGMSSATDAQLRWSSEVIHRQTRHLALLLDDLLDASRITRGKLKLRVAPVALEGVVDSAIETARPLIDARQHSFAVHLPQEPTTIDVDAMRLAQVIANLLTNAAKYTHTGGHIELNITRAGDEFVITVSDTGIGIPSGKLTSIFEMFSQLDAPIERTEGGLGVGLALVKGLVRLHGGTVAAHSEGPGKGSTFTVRLHATTTRATRNSDRKPTAGSCAQKLKLLIVDDNHDAAQSLAVLLSFDGHELRCACDGKEGLALAAHFKPDVIVLDIGLPDLTGYEIAQQLRATEWGKQATLIAASGWGQAEDKRRAKAAGFDRHLTKPIDIEEVRGALHEVQTRRSAAAAQHSSGA